MVKGGGKEGKEMVVVCELDSETSRRRSSSLMSFARQTSLIWRFSSLGKMVVRSLLE